MPSALASKPPVARHDDLDNYDAGHFSDDDPFGSPSQEDQSASKKRKQPAVDLGLDEEVVVGKRNARVPNVKLDEDRLLGPKGIPKLRERAGKLKLRGKGHEFSDAARLLALYQFWLDDLFPKANFGDALAMVEKVGHKKRVLTARHEWINEGKYKKSRAEEEDEEEEEDLFGSGNREPAAPAAFENPTTPSRHSDDVPGDDDLYDATPRAPRTVPISASNAVPDDDDLDALIAEAEVNDAPARAPPQPPRAPLARDQQPEEEDDLDAFIAAAEAEDGHKAPVTGASADEAAGTAAFDENEAALMEMEGM